MAAVLESSRRDTVQVCGAEQNGLPRVTLDTAITSSPCSSCRHTSDQPLLKTRRGL